MEITNDIYYVGVLNPNLKVFDITMKTNFGTSYNSYLIKDNYITLIDTVHIDFFKEYISNISKIIDVQDIKYLILNHTEPDHSGSIEKLLEINPNILIYCSSEAYKNICNMTNKSINANIVKDNDLLNIGSRTLTFKLAPFLHWPDTIFTYIESDKILFTGDFLGTHFCSDKIFDKDVTENEIYLECFKYYFDSIFSPFKQFVKKGLNILNSLQYKYILPSHGPVLKDNINKLIDIYESLSTLEIQNKITIVYSSAYGYTELIGNVIKDYIGENTNFKVSFLNTSQYSLDYIKKEIETSKALFIGSPTLNRDAVKPIWDVLANIDVYSSRGLVSGVFGAYAWSGEAVNMIKNRLSLLGLKVIEDGIKIKFKANDYDIVSIKEYTKKVIGEIK